ncbi:hypothetical protein RHGRI_006088 [Rhododendron griersonianum]|uniref:PB1 domain-containing protein n=1 Tax=Rhododendron griersonianum TaxID=479676 RepID=A0AAV6LHU7_9ERIC|nr:hypothetical protein RHGRI_006088 [Rhododendron griersonianum]
MMMMPIHIHGSVDDAHTILLGVPKDYFSPDFKEYIQKEQLNWSRFDGNLVLGDLTFGWVFWSQPQFSFTDNFGNLIRRALQKLISREELDGCLFQFWAATKTSEGRTLLTTQFQPFALGPTFATDARNGFCEYRMGMCREYNNSFYADAECAQEQLGLPGRVFLNQLPESTLDVKYYTLKEYPQRDLALRCEINESWGLPVFEHSSHTCVGVLEIVSLGFEAPFFYDKSILGQMDDIFQEFGLQCFHGYNHYEMEIGDENKARTTAFQELNTVLKTVCEIHNLPFAMTWVPCSACNGLLQGPLLSEAVEYDGYNEDEFDEFIEVIKCSHLGKGGVAGMVLSSPNMLYCSDITQLSLTEYPLVTYAQRLEFRGWFTLCLQSSYTANDIYALEFFLPTRNRCDDNSWTLLSLILGTMEDNFRTFKLASGQELGDLLSVKVMDFQEGQKLHSVQKIQAKGGVMLQLPPDSVAHTKPAFQDADIVTIRVKYENNTIKFRLSLPSRLVALQQEVAKRLDLEAGTYYVRYKDEENELILIACDQDLEDCIHTFKSLGNTSVVVLLELK